MENKNFEDYEEVNDLKKPSMGKRKILIIAFIITIIIIGFIIGYIIINKSDNSNINDISKSNALKVTTKKIDDNLIAVYVGGKIIDFGDENGTDGISDIKVIKDIVVFNRNFMDITIFYVVNSKAKIIYSMTGDYGTALKKTSGSVYRGNYIVKGTDIFITSDSLIQDVVSACNYLDSDKVQFVDKFTYLGDDKFSKPTLDSSVTSKDYIKENKIECSIKITTKVVKGGTEVYANGAVIFAKPITDTEAEVTNVEQIGGIAVFNLNASDVSTLYAVNVYGELILSTGGEISNNWTTVKLSGSLYRNAYKIDGNVIYITSDDLSQDDEYVACNSLSTKKVVFTDKITYLGNNKFSGLTLSSSITAKNYIADKKYTCPVMITTKDAGDDLVTVYANNNKIVFDDVLDTAGVTKITQLKDIAIFNKVGYDASILYIVNGNGGVIFSAGGKNTDDNTKVKLAGAVYRSTYSVDGNVIYITSDDLSQDDEYVACSALSSAKVQYVQKMTYLGDGKFSTLTLSSSLTAQQYIAANKIICSN